MLALWAWTTSWARIGPAAWLISYERWRSNGSCRALALTILEPWRVSWTWTSPNWLGTSGPVTVRAPPAPGAAVEAGGAAGAPGAAVVGGLVAGAAGPTGAPIGPFGAWGVRTCARLTGPDL